MTFYKYVTCHCWLHAIRLVPLSKPTTSCGTPYLGADPILIGFFSPNKPFTFKDVFANFNVCHLENGESDSLVLCPLNVLHDSFDEAESVTFFLNMPLQTRFSCFVILSIFNCSESCTQRERNNFYCQKLEDFKWHLNATSGQKYKQLQSY